MPANGKSRKERGSKQPGAASRGNRSNRRKSASETASATSTAVAADSPETAAAYVNQWNQLVSTTNWEKGRIICAWRAALEEAKAPAADYSDEAWANLVGGVTAQHVGRLRRVFAQFGEVWEEYPGLFWSHFYICMEWDDAEMWLEGAVQNGWSISQMRAARWKAHGAPKELKPSDDDIIVAQLDEDAVEAQASRAAVRQTGEADAAVGHTTEGKSDAPSKSGGTESAGRASKSGRTSDSPRPTNQPNASADVDSQSEEQRRPFANLPDLPDDVAEAFEQFKLAILTHKFAGWTEITREDLLASLDALIELACLPNEVA